MSDTTDRLRKVVDASDEMRRRPFAEYEQGTVEDWYAMNAPAGAFVGESTGFVVADPALVAAMLDVIDAADAVIADPFKDLTHDEAVALTDTLVDALARFREVADE